MEKQVTSMACVLAKARAGDEVAINQLALIFLAKGVLGGAENIALSCRR